MNGSAEQFVVDFEAFVTGRADEAARKRVWEHIEANSTPPPQPPRTRTRSSKAFKIILIALAILATLVGGTWAIFYPFPLMKDNFNDNWRNPSLWRFERPRVSERERHLWLQNRGCIVTQQEFPEPITVSFRWRWIDLAEDGAYAEVLAIALRTTGEMRRDSPFEIEDGFVITIDTQEGAVYLSRAVRGVKPRTNIASSGTARVPLPANEWHDIKVVDDGTTIALFLRGPATGEKYWESPVLSAPVDASFSGRRIAIYNREVVAGAPHLSHIDDFVVEQMPESSADQQPK